MISFALPYPDEQLEDLYAMPTSKLSKFGGPLHVLMKSLGSKHPPERPWIARLPGWDFVRGKTDYTEAEGLGETGIVIRFLLSPGTYEVYDIDRGRRRILVTDTEWREQ